MTKLERIILHTWFFQAIIDWSKRITLPGFQQLPLYDVLVFFIQQVKKVGFNERASAIAFNFLMAIPAATIFICTLIPHLPVSKQATKELLILTKDLTPNDNTYILVKDFLTDFLNTPRTGLLSFGFLVTIFYASRAVLGIMRSFDRSLIYSAKRNFFQKQWIAIKLTSILIFLIIITVLLLSMQGTVLNWILDWLHIKSSTTKWLIKNFRWIIITTLIYYAIAFIYRYAPAVHERWKLTSPGTILTTLLILLTAFIFSFWVNHFNSFNKIYGSIGTILIIMLLVFFNSLVLLIGYELNVSIHSLKHLADERGKK